MMKRFNAASGLGAVLATIAAMAIFVPWMSDSIFEATGLSGWDITQVSDFKYYFLPAVILAIGLFSALVFALAPKGNVTVAITVIIGFLLIILPYLTMSEFDKFLGNGFATVAWGTYLTMAAGTGTVICGAIASK